MKFFLKSITYSQGGYLVRRMSTVPKFLSSALQMSIRVLGQSVWIQEDCDSPILQVFFIIISDKSIIITESQTLIKGEYLSDNLYELGYNDSVQFDACQQLILFCMKQTGFMTLDQARSLLKKQFQKRYRKMRGKSESTIKNVIKQHQRNLSSTLHQEQKLNTQKHQNVNDGTELNPQKTLSQTLQQLNFNHHHSEFCVCDDCSCGRHLCKLSVIKPEMSKKTHYQHTFVRKFALQQTPVLVAKQTSPLKANHLQMQTLYDHDFKERLMDKLERLRNSKHLKLFEGPIQNLTTYGSLYIGHKGQNQYVKPTNKHKIGNFPISNKKTYNSEFVNKKIQKPWLQRIPDSLREGTTWTGASTYNSNFKSPEPENYASINRIKLQKYQKQLDNHSKYGNYLDDLETNYRKQFVLKPSTLCPSKRDMKRGSRMLSAHQKALYEQNYDFRDVSPEFKPLATGKITYS